MATQNLVLGSSQLRFASRSDFFVREFNWYMWEVSHLLDADFGEGSDDVYLSAVILRRSNNITTGVVRYELYIGVSSSDSPNRTFNLFGEITDITPRAQLSNVIVNSAVAVNLYPTGQEPEFSAVPFTSSTNAVYRIILPNSNVYDSISAGQSVSIVFNDGVSPALSLPDQADLNLREGDDAAVTLPEAENVEGDVAYALTPALPTGLSFNALTRQITGRPTGASAEIEYTYTATDDRGAAGAVSITFNITVARIDTTPELPDTFNDQVFEVGENVDLLLPAAMFGEAPITYGLVGNLPAGLSFNENNRRITGSPAAITADTGFVYSATDDDGDSDSLRFNIEIVAMNQLPSLAVITDQEVEVGSSVNIQLPVSPTGETPIRYTLTPALPSGLVFNEGANTIEGVPADESTAREYTYQAQDASGDIATRSFRITVNPRDTEPFITPIRDRSYTVGFQVLDQLPGSQSGNEPITYDLSPALPEGLRFDEDTRTIIGVPTGDTSEGTFVYVATDADGDTYTRRFVIRINLIDRVTRLPEINDLTFTVGRPVDIVLPFPEDGDPPFIFTLTPDLPAGLEFDDVRRQIRGIPTAETPEEEYSYSARDSDVMSPDVDTVLFNIAVRAKAPVAIATYKALEVRAALKIHPAAGGGGVGFNYWNGVGDLDFEGDTYIPGIVNPAEDIVERAQGVSSTTVNISAEEDSQFRAYVTGDPGIRLTELVVLARSSKLSDFAEVYRFYGRLSDVSFEEEYIRIAIANELEIGLKQVPDIFSDEFQSQMYDGDEFFAHLKTLSESFTIVLG